MKAPKDKRIKITLLHIAGTSLKALNDKRMQITLLYKASTSMKAFVNEIFLEVDIGV